MDMRLRVSPGRLTTGRLRFSPGRLRGRAVLRDPEEDERASSSLELFFDLTFVVAVNRASAALHHELLADYVARGVLGFGAVFFATWWAWMNFTWFNSAHDADDVPQRVLTLVQMAGVLVLAAGVTRAVEDQDFSVAVAGYVIMRSGLVVAWLRVARDVPESRTRALRYAGGIAAIQALWIARLAVTGTVAATTLVVLGVAEMVLPMWAERAGERPMFHARHIEERYGLFTIIVLGESILSAYVGFPAALDEAGLTASLLAVGLGGLVLAFAAWWIYFDHPGHLTPTPEIAFRWGYAHVVVFASLAALGAGLFVAADVAAGGGDERLAALAVAVPALGYVLGLVLVMVVTGTPFRSGRVYPKLLGAAAMLVIGLTAPVGVAVAGCAAVMTAMALAMVLVAPEPAEGGEAAAVGSDGYVAQDA
jgi:low temperature requirement protein LtrA